MTQRKPDRMSPGGHRGWVVASLLWAAMLCGVASAAESNDCMIITSARLEYDYQRQIAICEGDVVVTDPQFTMECDRLVVLLSKADDVKSVTATGNVRIAAGDRWATCKKAIYITSRERVDLIGDAVLAGGKHRAEGRIVTFWLNDERVEAEPGRLTLYPEGNKGVSRGFGFAP